MRRLDRHRVRMDFCALSGRAGVLDAEVRRLGGRVHLVPLDARFVLRFMRLVREERYAVVHSHVHLSSGLIALLAHRAGVPTRIVHFRSTHDGRAARPLRRAWRALMRALIDRHATHILGVCEAALEHGWGPSWRSDPRCRVIYNGIDVERLLGGYPTTQARARFGVPPDALMMLHVGRVAPPKNHARVVEIFAQALAKNSSCWLVLAGRGTDDPRGPVARRAASLGVAARVIALGETNDVAPLLVAADLLILPSLWEGLPGAALEACAAGVPVLASDLPGVAEIAARLPLVQRLPLSAPDAQWAEAALALPALAKRRALREHSADAFRSSEFHIDRAVQAHLIVWGCGARPAGAHAI
jgi:glycosyltransferase involved in cell wall biosynthesis